MQPWIVSRACGTQMVSFSVLYHSIPRLVTTVSWCTLLDAQTCKLFKRGRVSSLNKTNMDPCRGKKIHVPILSEHKWVQRCGWQIEYPKMWTIIIYAYITVENFGHPCLLTYRCFPFRNEHSNLPATAPWCDMAVYGDPAEHRKHTISLAAHNQYSAQGHLSHHHIHCIYTPSEVFLSQQPNQAAWFVLLLTLQPL